MGVTVVVPIIAMETVEPVRTVDVPIAQLDEWKRQTAQLNEMMRGRPENISEAEQAEYEAFLRLIGPV